ncbi:TniQ family protein [Acinetobacter baylyi]|uniref:TniQ family protein n=1 Tax=Acinetobacter baylyi TaxID=202950 RepID=UPI001D18F0DC|nr:TniQ family protein [Acinetobacter baylyi]
MLSHTPIPFQDEFIASFLLRASFSNGYQSPKQMLNSAGISVYIHSYDSIFTDEVKVKKIIENINFSDDLLKLVINKTPPTYQHFFWNNNKIVRPELLSFSLNKFCSICLEHGGYWKKNWLLNPLTACPDHKIDLTINCPECHNFLPTNRRSLFECPTCKFDLRKSSRNSTKIVNIKTNQWLIENLALDDANFIEIFFDIWTALHECFLNLEKEIDYSYILILCHDYFFAQDIFKEKIIKEIENNLAYAHPRIQLLPFLRKKSRFGNFLEKILSPFREHNSLSPNLIVRKISKIDTTHILDVSFIAFHKRLKSGILYHEELMKNDKAHFTTRIIEDWLVKDKNSINKPYMYNKPSLYSDDSNDYFGSIEISKILCINICLTHKFLKIPSIPTTKKFINDHKKYCLDKKFVIYFNEKYIFLSPLAKKLNVSVVTLKDKLASLNIKPIIENKLYPAYFSRDDVKHINKSIIENIRIYEHSFGRKKEGACSKSKNNDLLSLNEAALLLNISSQQVAQLIQHNWLIIDDPEIRPYIILRRSIDKFLQKKNDPSYIQIDEALQALNCTFNELQKNWVMTGFLTIRRIGYWRSIPKKQLNYILEIQKEFFTASEANAHLGMHRTHITNLVTRGLIKPHLFGNHNYSIRLFKKTDVEKLRQAGYGKGHIKDF